MDLANSHHSILLTKVNLHTGPGPFSQQYHPNELWTLLWTWLISPMTFLWLIAISLMNMADLYNDVILPKFELDDGLGQFLQQHLSESLCSSMMQLLQPWRFGWSCHASLCRSRHPLMSGNSQTTSLQWWVILPLPAQAFFWEFVLSSYVELVFPSHVS